MRTSTIAGLTAAGIILLTGLAAAPAAADEQAPTPTATSSAPQPVPATFVEQAGCDHPAEYWMRPDERLRYEVNGAPAEATVHQLPLNFTGPLTVTALDAATGEQLGTWSHQFTPAAAAICVEAATVHFTATAACGQLTVHAAVDPAGVPTVIDINDLVYGLPLAYGQFTVQPGTSRSYVYRLTPAHRQPGPDTVIVSIYAQHLGGDPLSVAVPHDCAPAHRPTPGRSAIGTPLTLHRGDAVQAAHDAPAVAAAAGPQLANTGARPLLELLVALVMMAGGASLILLSRRA